MNKSTSIVIHTGNLDNLQTDGLTITKAAEKELKKLIAARAKIDKTIEDFKEIVGTAMTKKNVTLIEFGDIKITTGVTGRKFAFDPKNKVSDDYTQMISYPAVNSKKVAAYLELKGKLPKGIIENARKIKVDIEVVE